MLFKEGENILKKIFALFIVAILVVGCSSNSPTTDQGTKPSTNLKATQSPTVSATPSQNGLIGGKYNVTFEEAEKVTSEYESGDLLMVTYLFTNNSQETVSADTALMLQGFQDGVEVDRIFDSSLTGDNESKSIKPGASLDCKALFKLSSTNDLEVEATEFLGMDNSKVTKTYTIQ